MSDEVEVDICCDALLDAIEGGGVYVVEVNSGEYCEVLPNADGEKGIAINYCPFCGQRRRSGSPDDITGRNLN